MKHLPILLSLLPVSCLTAVVYAAPLADIQPGQQRPEQVFRVDMEKSLSLMLNNLEQRGYHLVQGSKITLEATLRCPADSAGRCLRVSYSAPTLPRSLTTQNFDLTIDTISGNVLED